eukprot:3180646-Pleurochrysis_carterae.AAC.3
MIPDRRGNGAPSALPESRASHTPTSRTRQQGARAQRLADAERTRSVEQPRRMHAESGARGLRGRRSGGKSHPLPATGRRRRRPKSPCTR